MFVEIAICTWNRAGLLGKTLGSLEHLILPSSVEWRILLVDNNSTDSTPSVIEQFASQLPIVKLFERQQGHTFARNRAVQAADGQLLIWTDDDCMFNQDWITKYVNAAQNPDFDFWGSAIEPTFEQDQPKWIADNWEICKGCFASRDLGIEPVELSVNLLPYGANFAVRTEIQKVHQFAEGLGRKALQVKGEDELDLMRRLLADGCRGQWIPENSVRHVIPPERTTPRYVYDYFVGQGNKLAAQRTKDSATALRLRVSAWWNWWMYKLKKPFVDSHVWLSHMVQSALAYGKLGK